MTEAADVETYLANVPEAARSTLGRSTCTPCSTMLRGQGGAQRRQFPEMLAG
jgi:hypothetical protein